MTTTIHLLAVLTAVCCVAAALPKYCSLPKKVGPCRARLQRYYFNSNTNECEQFTYGGCAGNGNNFKSLKQCQNNCVGKPKPERCTLPSVTGMCRAYIPRYFYNSKTHKCDKFVYGGCGGNANNFKTLAECEQACAKAEPEISICEPPPRPLPKQPTSCIDISDEQPISCFDFSDELKDEPEPDKLKDEPEPDRCTLPSVTGMCRAYIPRYFYNSKTHKCDKFVYGGCGGNANNFKTLAECEQACGKPEPEICTCEPPPRPLPAKPEICICEPHFFKKVEETKVTVVKKVRPRICNLRRKRGRGNGRIKRYYFSKKYQKCRSFRFKGRRGNRNNFRSRAACEKICM